MSVEGWVLATETRGLAGMVSAVRGLGGSVTVVAVGPRSLADQAAQTGPDAVKWVELPDGAPAEAYVSALVPALTAARPRAVLAATTPQGRALLGAAAAELRAAVVSGVLGMSCEGDAVVVERTDLGGGVIETLASVAPVAGLFGGEDSSTPAEARPAPIEPLDASPAADMRIERTELVSGAGGGMTSAERVVAIGRGLKAKADLALVEGLATALGAEIACSMPIADDFGWVAKERYVGRSGQHIAPRLYVAIGISGAPQHLDGVRDARLVIAINIDPDAHIFRRADYGIVGDLYEVIPALESALATSPITEHV